MKNRRSGRGMRMVRGAAVIGVMLALAGAASAREIPKPLKGIVIGDRHRTIQPITLNGIAFESLNCFSELPYLMWPADGQQPVALTDDPEIVRAWLALCSRGLGFEGFEPRFVERFQWVDHEVLSYELVRRGMVLHDARIMVHFDGRTFLGIQNHVDGKILAIEDPNPADAAAPNAERVYYPVRVNVGEYRLVPATVDRVRQNDRTVVTIRGAESEFETVVVPDAAFEVKPPEAEFTEYRVPQGTFPDQISVAEDDIVWFSQPNNNSITSFNPTTATFTQHDTSGAGGTGPDGLIVGTLGRVWSGMYYSGSLGWLDTDTNSVHNVAAPYTPAAMAIPVETTDGSVWVTDHQYNRISEFNPVTETWIRSVRMPTSSCWVVQGHEDTDHGQVYFTEYNANQLGKIALGGNVVTDIVTPGGGPAFCVYSDGNVYYSRWNEAGMGVYNVESRTITEYEFPVQNEWGGPMWLRPNGDIEFGTRNRGYIMSFNPLTRTFSPLTIPTANPGLKDGLTVGANGVIWFTESGVNKITKLKHSRLTALPGGR